MTFPGGKLRAALIGLALTGTLTICACSQPLPGQTQSLDTQSVDTQSLDTQSLDRAEALIGLDFSDNEEALMRGELDAQLAKYVQLREVVLPDGAGPVPFTGPGTAACDIGPQPAMEIATAMARGLVDDAEPAVERPASLDALAFMSISELAALIQSRQVSVTEVTRFFLQRLRTYDDALEAVVTLTEERALEQAARLDAELEAGQYRGLLHGIPYGAKDLLAVAGYPTTWGAEPFRDQTFDETASVIQRLDAAGAVLVAKTTLGALAWGDVWFDGQTRNPWNLEQGSSGSSAGSAATVSAGLVPFSLGTETWGSIVSPASRVGITALRPTFGRVSRHGAMTLAWSMDKIGPLCRSAADCAIVFEAIEGCDGIDSSVVPAPYAYPDAIDIESLRIGYLAADFDTAYTGADQDRDALAAIEGLGAELIPVSLPDLPIDALSFVLAAEAAASFDRLTRTGRDDLLVRQIEQAWPNVFRAARLIPAVEYIQANRIRSLLVREMDSIFENVDVYIAPAVEGQNLLLTNLTGHPAVVVPNGFSGPDAPTSITFIGQAFDEGRLLALAARYQEATDFHRRHPPLFVPD